MKFTKGLLLYFHLRHFTLLLGILEKTLISADLIVFFIVIVSSYQQNIPTSEIKRIFPFFPFSIFLQQYFQSLYFLAILWSHMLPPSILLIQAFVEIIFRICSFYGSCISSFWPHLDSSKLFSGLLETKNCSFNILWSYFKKNLLCCYQSMSEKVGPKHIFK